MLKLYVDFLSDDGKVGMANNQRMIMKNAELLKTVEKKDKQSPIILQAGRFICCMVYSADKELGMVFLDLQKDERRALFASRQYVDSSTQKIFMSVFKKMLNEYERKYNEVQLVLDKNFIPDTVKN